MIMESVKIKLNGGMMPKKATDGSAAYDLYVPDDVTITRGIRKVIDLKFSVEIPKGYAATIQPRSGFSAKGMEVEVFDTYPFDDEVTEEKRIDADVIRGLIDSDYRGSVGVIIKINEMHDEIRIKKGTRIAQMQIVEVPQVELVEVEELSETDRGEGGFGHTGAR